ncbi:hypothetical protein DFJ73DRAFT_860745 [Zopfochytrium polystomum]|nr:hypothetical protein DFJ73DRAFT_860745 [Zopfochytrium polystomum]
MSFSFRFFFSFFFWFAPHPAGASFFSFFIFGGPQRSFFLSTTPFPFSFSCLPLLLVPPNRPASPILFLYVASFLRFSNNSYLKLSSACRIPLFVFPSVFPPVLFLLAWACALVRSVA